MSTARWGRIGFSLLAWVVAGSAIVQVYLAGQGIFVTSSFELHRNFGYLIGLLVLVELFLAFAGRLPWRMIGAAAVLLGLMALQSVLLFMRTSSPDIAALHPVNGFLIILLGLWIAWRSVGYIRAPLPPEKPRPEPVPVPVPAAPSGKPDSEDEQ